MTDLLVDWYFWVMSMRPDELLLILGILLLVDAPRYAYSVLAMSVWDCIKSTWTGFLPGPGDNNSEYCPRVRVVRACG